MAQSFPGKLSPAKFVATICQPADTGRSHDVIAMTRPPGTKQRHVVDDDDDSAIADQTQFLSALCRFRLVIIDYYIILLQSANQIYLFF